MRLAKLASPVCAAALAVLAAGCAHPDASRSFRLDPLRPSRTEEKLLRHDGPLSLHVDENGFATLEIPRPGKEPLGLALRGEDLPGVAKLDHTRPHEVRYWYHEERWTPTVVSGRGELVSIRDASGVRLDLSRCARHDAPMARRDVPIHYGLPMGEFLVAMRRDFPHPAFTLGGCVVNEDKTERRYVCPRCDAAARAWKPDVK